MGSPQLVAGGVAGVPCAARPGGGQKQSGEEKRKERQKKIVGNRREGAAATHSRARARQDGGVAAQRRTAGWRRPWARRSRDCPAAALCPRGARQRRHTPTGALAEGLARGTARRPTPDAATVARRRPRQWRERRRPRARRAPPPAAGVWAPAAAATAVAPLTVSGRATAPVLGGGMNVRRVRRGRTHADPSWGVPLGRDSRAGRAPFSATAWSWTGEDGPRLLRARRPWRDASFPRQRLRR